MYVSMHCKGRGTKFHVKWVRRHDLEQPIGSEDYILLTVDTDQGQTTLFLTPDQADDLAIVLGQAYQDRCVVLSEEAAATTRV